jgi:hypothetical protein
MFFVLVDVFWQPWNQFQLNSQKVSWNIKENKINSDKNPTKTRLIGKATKRNYFHNIAYANSDVDLFLYGLETEEQANQKLLEIYEAITDAVPNTVICFRSKYAVTLVSQYPYRHIQIILRLYKSPAEILMGFDVDCCAVGYDGKCLCVFVFVCVCVFVCFCSYYLFLPS